MYTVSSTFRIMLKIQTLDIFILITNNLYKRSCTAYVSYKLSVKVGILHVI